MHWGDELWDRYDSVVLHVGQTTRELETLYGSFFKERSKIENDYARNLRKLIKTYMPKDKKKKNREDESTQTTGFRYFKLMILSIYVNTVPFQFNSTRTWISSRPT